MWGRGARWQNCDCPRPTLALPELALRVGSAVAASGSLAYPVPSRRPLRRLRQVCMTVARPRGTRGWASEPGPVAQPGWPGPGAQRCSGLSSGRAGPSERHQAGLVSPKAVRTDGVQGGPCPHQPPFPLGAESSWGQTGTYDSGVRTMCPHTGWTTGPHTRPLQRRLTFLLVPDENPRPLCGHLRGRPQPRRRPAQDVTTDTVYFHPGSSMRGSAEAGV